MIYNNSIVYFTYVYNLPLQLVSHEREKKGILIVGEGIFIISSPILFSFVRTIHQCSTVLPISPQKIFFF